MGGFSLAKINIGTLKIVTIAFYVSTKSINESLVSSSPPIKKAGTTNPITQPIGIDKPPKAVARALYIWKVKTSNYQILPLCLRTS